MLMETVAGQRSFRLLPVCRRLPNCIIIYLFRDFFIRFLGLSCVLFLRGGEARNNTIPSSLSFLIGVAAAKTPTPPSGRVAIS